MKRYWIHFVTALVTFCIGIGISWFTSKLFVSHHIKETAYLTNSRCTHEKIQLLQPRSNARLSIVEATCHKFSSRVVLAVHNMGPKPITRLDIVMSQDYIQQKGVRSGQTLNPIDGVALRVGETKTVTFSGRFNEGESCRRGTGALQRSVFSIRRIDFADGSSWDESSF